MIDDQPEPEDEPIPLADEPSADVAYVLPAEAYEALVVQADALPDLSAVVAPVEVDTGREMRAAVQALGDRLDRRLTELQTLFDREIRAEATREKVVDRLHAELQEYKQDLLLNTLRPVFIDLIQLHDDIGKVAVMADDGDETVTRLVTLMHGFQQGIEDILYRQGVEPFEIEDEVFDPRRQRAVATVPTEDPARAKTVAERLRKGFRAGEKVIRPEVVSVYAIKK